MISLNGGLVTITKWSIDILLILSEHSDCWHDSPTYWFDQNRLFFSQTVIQAIASVSWNINVVWSFFGTKKIGDWRATLYLSYQGWYRPNTSNSSSLVGVLSISIISDPPVYLLKSLDSAEAARPLCPDQITMASCLKGAQANPWVPPSRAAVTFAYVVAEYVLGSLWGRVPR